MAEKSKLSVFLSLFPDRHQTFVRSRNSNTWRTTSQWHYLTDEEIASAITSRSSLFRAFGNQEKTSFVVIQVQGNSDQSPMQTVKHLHKLCMQKGVKAKPYYLKELDVWQLFIFLSEPTATLEATTVVENWLSTSWFAVDSETVSVLPNGSPLPIPLQAGFTWLNDNFDPVVSASDISLENAASMFLRDMSDCSNAMETLCQLANRDDQIDQPAYANQECIDEKPVASAEPITAPKETPEQLSPPQDICALKEFGSEHPIIESSSKTLQPDAHEEVAYAFSTASYENSAGIVNPLELVLVNQTDEQSDQAIDQAIDQSAAQYFLHKDVDQPPHSAQIEVTESVISLMESEAFEILYDALPAASTDLSAAQSRMKALDSASAESNAAYVVNVIEQELPEKPLDLLPAANIPNRLDIRDGPAVKKKSKPTIRSNLHSFEQLMLPFGLDTS